MHWYANGSRGSILIIPPQAGLLTKCMERINRRLTAGHEDSLAAFTLQNQENEVGNNKYEHSEGT
jgi:hypothetical protein